MILIQCGWCSRDMGVKEGPNGVTHSICQTCEKLLLAAQKFAEIQIAGMVK